MDLKRINDFEKSLKRLEEAISKTYEHIQDENYTFFRDSAIQRFEFTVEIMWKSIKEYLFKKEGIECVSPKSCVREFFEVFNIDEKKAKKILRMIDDKNLSSHTYHEEVAEDIFMNLKEYKDLMKEILESLKK